jgi:hypothetical protein
VIDAIRQIRNAHIAFDDSYTRARRVWLDDKAVLFGKKFHKPMSDLLSRYEAAAGRLYEAIETAEAEL